VELVWAVAGSDATVVDSLAGRVDGLVVAGTGGGHASPQLGAALVRLSQTGCPVVLATRCPGGGVLQGTYGGDGGERQLLDAGLVSAGQLSPVKARLRLLFGLSARRPMSDLFPV